MAGTATPDEEEALKALVDDANDEELLPVLENMAANTAPEPSRPEIYWQQLWMGLIEKAREPVKPLPVRTVRLVWLLRRLVAAAVVIGLLVTAGWWWFGRRPLIAPARIVRMAAAQDVAAPTTARATITLANGKRIDLDSAGNGMLATQGGSRVVKLANGQVAYQADPKDAGALLYNTLSNPRGSRVVALTLSDGTRVWLNAASSLSYPTVFEGGERKVAVTGEAYFEVASDPARPFRVTKGSTQIEVLGTHFNVNAYDDEEEIRVTLLEGGVKVSLGSASAVLRRGEQARVGTGVLVSKNADLEAVMAWKNGLFAFHDADLPTVMRQLARWYDVRVVYAGATPKMVFNGEIGKILTLDQVLHVLTTSRVHYTIDKNRILTIER